MAPTTTRVFNMTEQEKILREIRQIKLFLTFGFIGLSLAFIYQFTKIVQDRESEALRGAIELFKHTTDNFYKKPPTTKKKKQPIPDRI